MMNPSRLVLQILLSCALALGLSCTEPATDASTVHDVIEWEAVPAEDVGMSGDSLDLVVSDIEQDVYHRITSMIVVRNGRAILERYFEGDSSTLRPMYSVSKSVMSAVIGRAVTRGDFPPLDTRIAQWLPLGSTLDERWHDVTIGHLLTMSSGFEWSDDYTDGGYSNDFIALQDKSDPIPTIVERRFAAEPGSAFRYSSAESVLLSHVFQQATGRTVADYAREHLFAPLCIDSVEWTRLGDITNTGNGLHLSSRSLARIGQVYLDGGMAGGRRLIDSSWITSSLSARLPIYGDPGAGYSYQWWTINLDASIAAEVPDVGDAPSFGTGVVAMGWHGQRLALFPDQNLLVVVTAVLTAGEEQDCCDPTYLALRVLTATSEFQSKLRLALDRMGRR